MVSAAVRRAQLLDAARLLILKQGPRSTSMEGIARAAGVAKPTLYAYYPDKAAIFAALIEQAMEEQRQTFAAALSATDRDIVARCAMALVVKQRSAMMRALASPHAAAFYGEAERLLDGDLARPLESALAAAGASSARLLAQLLLAASAGVGQKAQSSAELGPALRLLCERLIRPELEDRS